MGREGWVDLDWEPDLEEFKRKYDAGESFGTQQLRRTEQERARVARKHQKKSGSAKKRSKAMAALSRSSAKQGHSDVCEPVIIDSLHAPSAAAKTAGIVERAAAIIDGRQAVDLESAAGLPVLLTNQDDPARNGLYVLGKPMKAKAELRSSKVK